MQEQLSASGDFYFRVDAGLARSSGYDFSQSDLHTNGGSFIEENLTKGGVVGIGIGRRLSSWLRTDLTGEYRWPVSIRGRDNLTGIVEYTGDIFQANTNYSGDLSAFAGLANVYVDLGGWHNVRPYVGAGIGFARIEVSDFRTATYGTLSDPNTNAVIVSEHTSATSRDSSEWNFAWALMAGLSIDVRPSTVLDIGYRYIDLGGSGSGSSDLLNCTCGTIGQPFRIDDLSAHEIRIGLRFALDGDRNAPPPPLK